MNEASNNIWKKPLRGPGGYLLVWLGLMVAVGIIFTIIVLGAKSSFGGPVENGLALVVMEMVITAGFALVFFIRWLCCWKNFRRLFFGSACFATIIALIYAEEDWRGKHDWEKFKSAWEAKGEKLDFASIAPPPVPDEQNFAMSPVCVAEIKECFLNQPQRVEPWYGNRLYSEAVSNLTPRLPMQLSGLAGTNSWSQPGSVPELPTCRNQTNLVDLRLWQNYYRDWSKAHPTAGIPISPQPQTAAADVLLALSKYDPVIEQERAASRVEFSRFPIQYDDANPAVIILPHLGVIVRRHTEVLHLRAIAEMENNRPDLALDDLKLMLRLIDSAKGEPFLISHLVRAFSMLDVIQVVGQGLAEHRWTAAQLVELDSELAKFNFPADGRQAIKSGMVFCSLELNYLRRTRDFDELKSELNYREDSPGASLAEFINHYTPGGWFYESQLRYCRILAQNYLTAIDGETRTIAPKSVKLGDLAMDAQAGVWDPLHDLTALQRRSLTSTGDNLERMALGQAMVDLARTAMALERYRLAHGELPESLEALAPQFIAQVPHDVIGGQPLKYRREADGRFVLYSIGWNETDDGGVPAPYPPRSVQGKEDSPELNQGDWMWQYPG